MTAEEAIAIIDESIVTGKLVEDGFSYGFLSACREALEKQIDSDKAYQQGRTDAEKSEWHMMKYHEIKDEEREKEAYPKEWVYHIDCLMPEDNEKILIVTEHKGKFDVDADINYCDNEYYLDSGEDWINVIAWREMPKFEAEQLKEQKND